MLLDGKVLVYDYFVEKKSSLQNHSIPINQAVSMKSSRAGGPSEKSLKSGRNGENDKEAKPSKWTIHDAKSNLAALLNDPGKLRRDYDLFTKTWGETFKELPSGATASKSIRVPEISEIHFKGYLERTSDKYLRHKSQFISESDSSSVRSSEDQPSSSLKSERFSTERRNSKQIAAQIALQQQKRIQAATRQALDNIPKMFLRQHFVLEDPQTFAAVLNYPPPRPDHRTSKPFLHEVSSSKLLQERLSHYLDQVEVAIVRQISVQSDAFFDAMASHDDLNDYLSKMLVSVHQLHEKVTTIEKSVCKTYLQVMHAHCRKRNSTILLDKLRTMITVHQAQPTIQLLLSTNEYAGALDLIETTQEVLKQELAGLHCFRHLGSQLSEIENVIGHMMQEEMSCCIRNDIHRPLSEGYCTIDPHHLTAISLGLLRKKRLNFFEELREEIKLAVKTIIKTTVLDYVLQAEGDLAEECTEQLYTGKNTENNKQENCDSGDEESKEKPETLAERMRGLQFVEWIKLLNNIFQNLTLFLKRIKSFLSIIAKVACTSSVKTLKEIRNFTQNSTTETVDESTSDVIKSNCNGAESSPEATGHGLMLSPPIKHGQTFGDVWDDMDQYEAQLMESVSERDLRPGKPGSKVKEAIYNQDTAVENGQRRSSLELQDTQSDHSPTKDPLQQDILLSEAEHNELIQSLCDHFAWTADYEHDRCVKVIIAKNKNASLERLTSTEFLLLAQSLEKYLAETENILYPLQTLETEDSEIKYFDECFAICHGTSNRGGGVLRGVLQSQASRFVSRFHEERRNKLSLLLDNETWKQTEVPSELAQLLQNMSVKEVCPFEQNGPLSDLNMVNGNSPTKSLNILLLDGQKYAVVSTVLLLLKMVSEYCSCADDLPASTSDIVTRVSELLTLFNSRTCQLVLGAGAMQLAGLKTISTRNLGLASRCLQLVLHMLPSIKHRFQLKLNQFLQLSNKSKQLNVLKHFDHVSKDFKDHISEIDNKLVSIMDSVFENNLSKWEVKAPMPSREFRMVCRQMTKLHEMIYDLLPEEQTRRILHEMHKHFKTRLKQMLQQYGVRNNGGPQYGLVMSDVAFYQGNIKNIKVLNDADLDMNTIWSLS